MDQLIELDIALFLMRGHGVNKFGDNIFLFCLETIEMSGVGYYFRQ